MERGATNDFLLELAEEEEDAQPFADAIYRPEDTEWPEWSGSYRRAWNILRDDRFYGAMGGMGRIYYAALATYAKKNDIDGDEFELFIQLVWAMDEEYILICDEKSKIEADKAKSTG